VDGIGQLTSQSREGSGTSLVGIRFSIPTHVSNLQAPNSNCRGVALETQITGASR